MAIWETSFNIPRKSKKENLKLTVRSGFVVSSAERIQLEAIAESIRLSLALLKQS
jgi:hypothetical protein